MNILSFDIEEWFIYDKYPYYGGIKSSELRLEKHLNNILDLLDQYEFKATFFCLGEVARLFPKILKLIYERGHHIGCHSNKHEFLINMTPAKFEEDTRIAIENIEDVIGEKVNAYRAPAFTITQATVWSIEILVKLGIEYDSSVFPAERRYGGFPELNIFEPTIIEYKGCQLKEFPMCPTRFLGSKIVFSGGGYFRLLPYFIVKKLFEREAYVMSYFHLRDFDSKIIEIVNKDGSGMSMINYFMNFYGIRGAFEKFKNLLLDTKFINIIEADERVNWNNKYLKLE